MSEERSEAGDPIHRHQPRETSWEPPDMEDSQMEMISDHVERHIGKIETVFHELVSDLVHIDVHQVPPTPDRPWWTLITSGMSDKPMKAPPGAEDFKYAELMLCLPANWRMGQADFNDERWYWPIRWLKLLARMPHEYDTWLSWGHTIPNGDPAEAFAPGVPFTCMILDRPSTVSVDFWTLPVRSDKTIHFFSVLPLYSGETELKLKEGAESLLDRMEKKKVTELVNLKRPDVSKKSWWPFGG